MTSTPPRESRIITPGESRHPAATNGNRVQIAGAGALAKLKRAFSFGRNP